VAREITVYEVGPRDGLQNEAREVPLAEKLELIERLADAGIRRIEATSFVSPKWIPQLADAAEVVARLPRRAGLGYVVLVPNTKGLDRLREALDRAGADRPRVDAAVFLSASETHNRKNVNKGVDETLSVFEEVLAQALGAGLAVRGYVSTAFGCPYEGAVAPERVVEIASRLVELGCHQVSLGDTIGVGTPNQVRDVSQRLLARLRPEQVALHLHDTRGTALANVLAGLDAGISTFDASIGGLGGCPYAPGASGNLATEDLVYMLRGMGYETNVDFEKLIAAGELAERVVGRKLPGKALQAELGARERSRSRTAG
jgi:hydroxymethylglutaryl-CoA lyase